jgi:aspartate/tyrosine/aromatic aminotransferase
MYSNPPRHGAHIVAAILNDPKLFKEWDEELAGMAGYGLTHTHTLVPFMLWGI